MAAEGKDLVFKEGARPVQLTLEANQKTLSHEIACYSTGYCNYVVNVRTACRRKNLKYQRLQEHGLKRVHEEKSGLVGKELDCAALLDALRDAD
jgi:hypothetical protein